MATLALAVVLLAAFFVAERRHPRPLLPPELFRSRELVTANAAIMLARRFGGALGVALLGTIALTAGYQRAPWARTCPGHWLSNRS